MDDVHPWDRDHVYVRGRPVTHQVAQRDWRCGRCESRLRTVYDGDLGWITVCARDRAHPIDGFIHQSTLARRVDAEMTMAGNLELAERRLGMGLRDRNTETGAPQRVRLARIGRVRQGIKVPNKKDPNKEHPVAVDYFILDPAADGAERDQVLADARSAIAARAPGQNLERPTVLPIMFLAEDDELIAPESYKIRRGKSGMVWCAGDGETIQWKLDDDFRVQISGGANADTGEIVSCPGRSKDSRHPWCTDCSPELELNFAIVGYERTGVWMLRTGSMVFRDQFWTQIGLVRAMAGMGLVPGLAGVPFLLRRQKETTTAPIDDAGHLASIEMPITTIEIDPSWLREVMRRNPRLALAAPSAPPAPPALQAGVDWDRYAAPAAPVETPARQATVDSTTVAPGRPATNGTQGGAGNGAQAGKCPVCAASGNAHAPWCQDVDGIRIDTRKQQPSRAEPKPSPTSAPTQRGKPPLGNAMELLAAVNQVTNYHYKNIKHIENVLGVHAWPRSISQEQWRSYYDTLVARVAGSDAEEPPAPDADVETVPETPPAEAPDDLPF